MRGAMIKLSTNPECRPGVDLHPHEMEGWPVGVLRTPNFQQLLRNLE